VALREKFVAKKTALEALIADANRALDDLSGCRVRPAGDVEKDYEELNVSLGY
jgi:hypothetical protein